MPRIGSDRIIRSRRIAENTGDLIDLPLRPKCRPPAPSSSDSIEDRKQILPLHKTTDQTLQRHRTQIQKSLENHASRKTYLPKTSKFQFSFRQIIGVMKISSWKNRGFAFSSDERFRHLITDLN
uniref:Uncharacterized protein n=1 Tax=Kalanchoe fedtschenkoi TaxID=63787 RepID=A0A7N0VMC4_KALFE